MKDSIYVFLHSLLSESNVYYGLVQVLSTRSICLNPSEPIVILQVYTC